MKSLIWATNLAAPYRIPVWDELSGVLDLRVWLLAVNEPNRHWSLPESSGYEVNLLRTQAVSRGDNVYYALAHQPNWTAGVDAIILPAWSQPAAWQLLTQAKHRGVTTLALQESTRASQRYSRGPVQWARRRFLTSVDHVLTVNDGSTQVARFCGVVPERITQTVNAIDLKAIVASSGSDPKAARYTYMFCGQLIERKQPLLLLRALAQLEDQASTLLIVGDGPLGGALIDEIHSLGLRERVTMTGYLEPREVWARMAASQTLVMPSSQEVHGLVVAEALTAGMHVVLSDVAGIAPTVAHMPGVWVTRPSLRELTSAMRLSGDAWTGPIRRPPILDHGPDAMAKQIARVVEGLTARVPNP